VTTTFAFCDDELSLRCGVERCRYRLGGVLDSNSAELYLAPGYLRVQGQSITPDGAVDLWCLNRRSIEDALQSRKAHDGRLWLELTGAERRWILQRAMVGLVGGRFGPVSRRAANQRGFEFRADPLPPRPDLPADVICPWCLTRQRLDAGCMEVGDARPGTVREDPSDSRDGGEPRG